MALAVVYPGVTLSRYLYRTRVDLYLAVIILYPVVFRNIFFAADNYECYSIFGISDITFFVKHYVLESGSIDIIEEVTVTKGIKYIFLDDRSRSAE